ncbi:MAG: hypothetical protein KF901_25890 [Myxococcales bacterium]|nr:hypothetical protein [Myxococcales bacterium]
MAREVHARGQYAEDVRFRGRSGSQSSFPSRGNGSGEADAPRSARLGPGRGDLDARRVSDGATGRPPQSGLGGLFGSASTLVSKVLLVVVAVALVALVAFLIVALLRRRRDEPAEVATPRSARRPTGASAVNELLVDPGDPDALAAEGRYAEAILALLIRALRLAGWQPEGQRSRTAREVLFGLPSSDPRHAPLDHVVRRAERARFAGDPPTEALFQEVREGYEALRRARGEA